MFDHAPWSLVVTAALHGVIAIGCAAALLVDARPILGVHPAAKPLKFAISIALLLGSSACVLAVTDGASTTKTVLAWALASTMLVEMVAVGVQALRGVPSHFNTHARLDSLLWAAMFWAIIAATVAFIALAILVTIRPLTCAPDVALAVRAGMWMILLAAVSGFAMGGRQAHSVGGRDGERGIPLANWSRTHGDLRAPHFFALHGLQALPAAAWMIDRLPVSDGGRHVLVIGAVALWSALAIATLVQAFCGRPLTQLRRGSRRGA